MTGYHATIDPAEIGQIESCWSVAGEESYILKAEDLLARIRAAANPYENRPVT